ncbi:MAG: 3-phosphoshikimate 1-carboxyvinyltransferase [Candidatus Palauibacterales bacterium]|nr:3-phosphoshikimate 1-carboxyvinyltransferase [Candidatus Palauibacterales bacterium]
MSERTATEVEGIRVPGDKSLSHRALMLAPLARGTSRIRGILDADDVRSTAGCLRTLGARVPEDWSGEVEVPGPAELHDASEDLDCGNSGTTARILSGIIAGLGVEARLDGDASLRRRPMERIVYPLQAMGAKIDYEGEEGHLPFRIHSRATGSLRTMRHIPKVASAQVKSCMLLAGLAGGVRMEVVEPGRSRDHTERLLEAMGAPVEYHPVGEDAPLDEGTHVTLDPEGWDGRLEPLDFDVPGDLSSAAFLAVAALAAGRPIRLPGVGLNPTRSGFLDVIRRAGARVEVHDERSSCGEPRGDLRVEAGELRPFRVEPAEIPTLLDEVPALVALAARIPGESEIRGAEELRVKESDRLALLAENLDGLGVDVEEREDGLRVSGSEEPLRGSVRTGGDHRIAMAFGALSELPANRIEFDDRECVGVSYPGFWEDVRRAVGG